MKRKPQDGLRVEQDAIDIEIERWGCPDWRDAKAYPSSPNDLTDWEWRWQFMRRWRVYRKLYFSLPRKPSVDPELEFDLDDNIRGLGQAGLSDDEADNIRHLTNMQVLRNPFREQLPENPFHRDKGGVLFRLPSSGILGRKLPH